MMNRLTRTLAILTLALVLPMKTIAAELVIVTSTENTETFDIDDVARIYLGKVNQFPSGAAVIPLDIDPMDPSFAVFAREVLKKNPSQLRAYWAKRVFTGRGKPPQIINTSAELRALVSSDKRYLAYLVKSQADSTVRAVIELEP